MGWNLVAQSDVKPHDPTCSEISSIVLMDAQVEGARLWHCFPPSGHLCFLSSPLVTLLGFIHSCAAVERVGWRVLLWGRPLVLPGVSSGHVDHGIHESGACTALRFSRLSCNREVVTVLKFLSKQLTFYFLKCLSLKALESCAIFEQAPFQLDTSLATGP